MLIPLPVEMNQEGGDGADASPSANAKVVLLTGENQCSHSAAMLWPGSWALNWFPNAKCSEAIWGGYFCLLVLGKEEEKQRVNDSNFCNEGGVIFRQLRLEGGEWWPQALPYGSRLVLAW